MVVASAGNNSEDAQDYSPAGCNHVVTVGAVTLRGDQTTFSNHGDTLDVSAFGQQVRVQGTGWSSMDERHFVLGSHYQRHSGPDPPGHSAA